MLRVYTLIACLLLAQAGWAGQLTLANGDAIQGKLKGILGDEIVWQSDQLGEIKVPKKAVREIQADDKLKIRGKEVACWIESTTQEHVMFACEDGDLTRVPLLSLKQVVPFTGHAAANYSYWGKVRASGWRQTGTTESSYGEILVNAELRHSDWRHIMRIATSAQSNTVRNAATGATVTARTNRAIGEYGLNWFFVPQWYWANRITAESDDNLNIQEQYTAASGLGYQVWESSKVALAFELGLEHSRVYRRINPLPNEPEVALSARPATRFRYDLMSGVRFYHTSEYRHPLTDPGTGQADRKEFRSDTGLDFPIGFGVSANLSIAWNYASYARDANPYRSSTDTIYRFGVNYSW